MQTLSRSDRCAVFARTAAGLLLLAAVPASSNAEPPPIATKLPALTLQLVPISKQVFVGNPIRLQLTATNQTDKPIRVVRPRVNYVETYGDWGCWTLSVVSANGAEYRSPLGRAPGAFVPPIATDGIELRPRESVGALFDITTFGQLEKNLERMISLNGVTGRVSVTLTYHKKPGDAVFPPDIRTPGSPESSPDRQPGKSLTELRASTVHCEIEIVGNR